MKSILNATAVFALSRFVSDEETRYYLQGIQIEANPSGAGMILVATDGHALGAWNDETASGDAMGILRLTPKLVRACKPRKGAADRVLTIEDDKVCVFEATGETVFIQNMTEEHPAPFIDGTYPDWRRIIPDYDADPQPIPTCFNPELLGRFDILGTGDVGGAEFFCAAPLKEKMYRAVAVRLRKFPQFVGVCMPMAEAKDKTKPDAWWRLR